jgi:hypothetical protein
MIARRASGTETAVAVAIALVTCAGGAAQAGRAQKKAVSARTARTAISRALVSRPEPGLRPADLGKVRVVGTYKKGEGKGVANSTGFVADTTIVAAEFVSPLQLFGRRVETFAIAPDIGAVNRFPGHPRWHLTLSAARDAAVTRAQRDHGPSAFAWPVGVSRSGKSLIFESMDHDGRRDRYFVRMDKRKNRVAVQRAVLPPER